MDTGQVTKLTWPQVTNIKNPRYTSCTNNGPHQLLKVWNHCVRNCGCGRISNLLNCVLRWHHLTWPVDLTWYDLGKIFTKMRKIWVNSYAKIGGAAHRRYYATCEKPMGGGAHMCPSDVRRIFMHQFAQSIFLHASCGCCDLRSVRSNRHPHRLCAAVRRLCFSL